MEYCLVPRKIADKMHNVSIETKFSKPSEIVSNPDIGHLVDLVVDGKSRDYALNLLKYYQMKYPQVHYDEKGDLSSPIANLNILDVIVYFSSHKSASPSVKSKIRQFNSLVPIPEAYIKHKSSRDFIKKPRMPSPDVFLTGQNLSPQASPPSPPQPPSRRLNR